MHTCYPALTTPHRICCICVRQHQNTCSQPPLQHQYLSTCHDWLVKKAIVNLSLRLKGNLKPFPVIRWFCWEARTRILALLCRCYLLGLDYVWGAGYLPCPVSKVKESGIHPGGKGLSPPPPYLKLLNSRVSQSGNVGDNVQVNCNVVSFCQFQFLSVYLNIRRRDREVQTSCLL